MKGDKGLTPFTRWPSVMVQFQDPLPWWVETATGGWRVTQGDVTSWPDDPELCDCSWLATSPTSNFMTSQSIILHLNVFLYATEVNIGSSHRVQKPITPLGAKLCLH